MSDTDSTATKTVAKAIPGRRYLRATVTIRDGHPTLSDGFSVTGELYEPHGTWDGLARYRNDREPDASGCIHGEISRYMPELAPFIELHLADLSGLPMHAKANGWHFYSGTAREWEERRGESWHNREGLSDHERAARALSISPDELPVDFDTEDEFGAFVDSLAERYAARAAAARKLFGELV